jgi:hypothetical protein
MNLERREGVDGCRCGSAHYTPYTLVYTIQAHTSYPVLYNCIRQVMFPNWMTSTTTTMNIWGHPKGMRGAGQLTALGKW